MCFRPYTCKRIMEALLIFCTIYDYDTKNYSQTQGFVKQLVKLKRNWSQLSIFACATQNDLTKSLLFCRRRQFYLNVS